jgi:hypothetical protein
VSAVAETTKYTLELSREQNESLAQIQTVLKASSKADVIRKSLGLAALMAEITAQGHKLAIVDTTGKVVETIRIM